MRSLRAERMWRRWQQQRQAMDQRGEKSPLPDAVDRSREDFEISGPSHLSSIQWCDNGYRRSIAACLVNAVYVLEHDSHRRGPGSRPLAKQWWTSFHFRLVQRLVDEIDGSMFAAVFKWSKKDAGLRHRPYRAPKIVVAFRGTDISPYTLPRDLLLDFEILRNNLHNNCRFELGFDAVRKNVHKYGADNVWIAGHSLGASLGLLVGRRMAERGSLLECHLFNPPFVSAPLERIRDERTRMVLQLLVFLICALIAVATRSIRSLTDGLAAVERLSSWSPLLYVHPRDDICSAYIGYFRYMRNFHNYGLGSVALFSAQYSLSDFILSRLGWTTEEPVHMVPSANLNINMIPVPNFLSAHSLQQWWAPDANVCTTDFTFQRQNRDRP